MYIYQYFNNKTDLSKSQTLLIKRDEKKSDFSGNIGSAAAACAGAGAVG
jgi:hypothetical protein